MRIIVLAKAVPATIANPQPSPEGDRVSGKVGPLVMNEPDEYALEWAMALKEKLGGEVVTLTSGSKSAQKIMVTAFAKGTDRAVRVDSTIPDSERHAEILAKAVIHIGYDLIITGVESADNMSSQVGVAVAEKLGIPFVYSLRDIKPGKNPDTVEVIKELGGGITQVVEVGFPAVLCVQACTIPLSLISVMRFLQARNETPERLTLRQLELTELPERPAGLKIIDVFRPPKTRAKMLEGKPEEIAKTLMEIIHKGD